MTTTLSNEMNEILALLNLASYGTASFEELPVPEQDLIAHKLQLKQAIKLGGITNVEKAKKWLELIELIYDWALDNQEYDFQHDLVFYEDGSVLIQSYYGDYEDEFEVDFVDGVLLLNGEEFNSINFLMNAIEFNLAING
ncbi:hypothetical protein [Bacillus sp. FJAT-29814]|uniref:hypothetical protein n=1 Tax=Bacillus sp. FJAT-29814 TaxID=1729688 RepID=UPI00082E9875|nr:hypothetical protein [Bacillus sp. FJAT-29814]